MRSLSRLCAMLLMGLSAVAFAADTPEQKPDDKKAPPPQDQQQPPPPPQEGGRQGGGGGRGEGRGGGGFNRGGGQGGGMGIFRRNALDETLAGLGDLNLAPDFTLTSEQKQKIQTIRDDYKKSQAKWRSDNADAFKKIEDQVAEIRGSGQEASRDEMRQIGDSRRKLMETAADESAKQVLAVLSPEQAKQLETKQAAVEKERQEMRERFGGGGFGGGPGGGGERRGGGGGNRQGGGQGGGRGEF